MRIIQKKTGKLYSVEKVVECLNRISCSNEDENIYLFDYRSDISDVIGEALGIDFTNKRLRLGNIKRFLAQAKKRSFPLQICDKIERLQSPLFARNAAFLPSYAVKVRITHSPVKSSTFLGSHLRGNKNPLKKQGAF